MLSVAYDGTPFCGFAMQRDHRTVAGELLGALQTVDPHIRDVRGASRTDSGVHAHDQRVAFDPSLPLPLTAWLHGLAKSLPSEIAVRGVWAVERGFIPRFRAIQKTYRYLILADPFRAPFFEGRVWRVRDIATDDALARMRAEAAMAVGTHDFAAFRAAGDKRAITVRTLERVEVSLDPEVPLLIRVDVTGSSFLYNMVRILVGAIVDVGRDRIAPGAIQRGLSTGNRRALGITAPAEGLYLKNIVLDGDAGRGPSPTTRR